MAVSAKRLELETAMRKRAPARAPQGPGDPPSDEDQDLSLRNSITELRTDVRELRTWLLSGGLVLMSAFTTGYLLLDKRVSDLDTKLTTESKDLRASVSASSDRIYDKLLELNASVARLDERVAPGAAADSPGQKPTKPPANAPRP